MASFMGKTTHQGPIAADSVKKSEDVQPKVMTRASTVETQASSLMHPKVKFSEVQAGDIIFKVATSKSADIYQTIIDGQVSHVRKFCNNSHMLPVPAQTVVHCDVSLGDGEIAMLGGPDTVGQWMVLGNSTPSKTPDISVLKSDTEHYIVMRPKNENIAQHMAEKAKETAELPVTYDIVGLIKTWILHDRGKQESPLLTGEEQGPQIAPLNIPKSMICSEFVANIVMDGEREALREDRNATTPSIDRTKITPTELMDKLLGASSYDMLMLDQSE